MRELNHVLIYLKKKQAKLIVLGCNYLWTSRLGVRLNRNDQKVLDILEMISFQQLILNYELSHLFGNCSRPLPQ